MHRRYIRIESDEIKVFRPNFICRLLKGENSLRTSIAKISSIIYRLLYGRGVPRGHIGTRVAISARGPIWPRCANMI